MPRTGRGGKREGKIGQTSDPNRPDLSFGGDATAGYQPQDVRPYGRRTSDTDLRRGMPPEGSARAQVQARQQQMPPNMPSPAVTPNLTDPATQDVPLLRQGGGVPPILPDDPNEVIRALYAKYGFAEFLDMIQGNR